jgi:ribosome maturation factor RimP
VVDIYVDSDEELSIKKLAEVNREVGFLLDVEDLIPGRYNLNVSSPGLDRPLRLPRQYRKNIGKPLRVHYNKPDGAGTTEIEGELVDVDDVAIEVKDGGDVRSIPLQDIVWAKIRLPW